MIEKKELVWIPFHSMAISNEKKIMFIRSNGSTIVSEKLYSSFSHSIFYYSMRTLFAEQQYLSIASKQFVEMIQLNGYGDAAVFNAI